MWSFTDNLRRATLIAGDVGRFIGFGFILFGLWQLRGGNFVRGVWIMLVGWFLESAAVAQIHQQRAQTMLGRYRASNAMSGQCLTVAADENLRLFVEKRILGGGRRCFIVVEGDLVAGLVTLHRLREMSRAKWPTATVTKIMVPLRQMKSIGSDTDLWIALKKMNRDGVNQLPVLSGDALVGVLTTEDVIGFVQTTRELDGDELRAR